MQLPSFPSTRCAAWLALALWLPACSDGPALGDVENASRMQSARAPRAMATRSAAADETALLAVRFSPDGTLRIGAVSPRPIPFRTASAAYDAVRFNLESLRRAPQRASAAPSGAPAVAPVVDGAASHAEVGLAVDPAHSGTASPGAGATGAHAPSSPSPHNGGLDRVQQGAGVIVVTHESRPVPFVVNIDLGVPGEGGGDVMDRWQEGSAILRAPYFGPGTHYAILRTGADGAELLAEAEVQP